MHMHTIEIGRSAEGPRLSRWIPGRDRGGGAADQGRSPPLIRRPRLWYSSRLHEPSGGALLCRPVSERGGVVARSCQVCGKGPVYGNQISHAHNVSSRVWYPNVQKVRVVV